MTALTRRAFAAFAAAGLAVGAAPSPAETARWIDAVGLAFVRGPADREAARRRALADALLSAALAGGAEVRARTALQDGRVRSDVLLVRPVGRILAFRTVSAVLDGTTWQVRIRARVGPPGHGDCTARRRLPLAMRAPRTEAGAAVPAWAAAILPGLSEAVVAAAAAHPAVSGFDRLPPRQDSAQDRSGLAYRAATRPQPDMPPDAHDLQVGLALRTSGRDLRLSADFSLAARSGEVLALSSTATVALPGASVLGRADVLARAPRAVRADRLTRGVIPALVTLLDAAACHPPVARLQVAGDRIIAPIGRRSGLRPADLAMTDDSEGPAGLLQIEALGSAEATLLPLDPTVPAAVFAGRVVRFIDLNEVLP